MSQLIEPLAFGCRSAQLFDGGCQLTCQCSQQQFII
jgi:hypothetical protein